MIRARDDVRRLTGARDMQVSLLATTVRTDPIVTLGDRFC